ncbi:MAG: hypothetical protein LC624_04125, partial [Halobacteriales archaeon]|nr:hypothetical protein [Halobacteriales archaeon]
MPLRVCLASQTPPVRFLAGLEELAGRYPELGNPADLAELQPGVDFQWTTGGVPVMLRDLLRTARARGAWKEASWVALNPTAPPEVRMDGTRLHSVHLPPRDLQGYAQAKEKMWNEVHGLGRARISASEFA